MGFLRHLPDPLLQAGPYGLALWQWLALPIFFLLAWALGSAFGRVVRALLGHLVRRSRSPWDDKVVDRLGGPMTLAGAVAVAHFFLPALWLHDGAESLVRKFLRTTLFAAFFWLLLRLVTVVGQVLGASGWAVARPATRSLLPLGGRILQIAVIAMAVVAVLADFGYPVGSLIAGLGIGGLALALAGQKTVENLFGAFSIGVDQPFRVGDLISAEGVQGHVEVIGLRSTRIRTPDRTVVTIPNGKLADMRIECFAPRDRIRFAAVLGLSRATTAVSLRDVLAGFERVLRAQPKLWPEGLAVHFKEITSSSLDVEVAAWFETADGAEFLAIRQEVLLGFMGAIEKAGTGFALPTRVVHVKEGAF